MEVNDEDAEALEIVLRAMYGIAYQPPKADSIAAVVAFHIRVATTASRFKVHDFAGSVATLIKDTSKGLDSVPEILDVLKTFPRIPDVDHVLANPVESLVRRIFRRLTGDAGFTRWLASQPYVHQTVLETMGQLFDILYGLLYARCSGCEVDYFFFRDDKAARANCASCREGTKDVGGDLMERAFGAEE